MKKLALLAAVVFVVSCHGVIAVAQTLDHFVGPSYGWVSGNSQGRPGMNYYCQNAYGPTAHMCDTDEFFQTAAVKPGSLIPNLGPAPYMWVHPVFHNVYWMPCNVQPCYGGSLSFTVYGCFAAGGCENVLVYPYGTEIPLQGPALDVTCFQWSTNDESLNGLAIWSTKGQLEATPVSCNTHLQVACCAPRTVPGSP
jgi:hypothetical protein